MARLAGLPTEVIGRARTLLAELERSGSGVNAPARAAPVEQLPLFESPPHPVIELLRDLNIHHMTPVQALVTLAELADQARH